MPICDAMVLCAGLGTRLQPLTFECAKPAVPLLNRPLVEFPLARLRALGLDRVTINTHWLPGGMTAAARRCAQDVGLQLDISHEPDVLGTGGGLRQALDRGFVSGERPLLVLNGDVWFDVDLRRVLDTHVSTQAAATMVLQAMPAGGGYSPIEADETGRIVRIGRYGETIAAPPQLFTGVHVLSPEALRRLPEGVSGVVETVYAPLLAEGARLQAAFEPGRWLDLGDPAGYLAAHRELAPEGLVDPSAHVDPSATVERSTIGAGARIPAGARISDSVVWAGAELAPGEVVTRTIVTPRARVAVP